MASLPMPLARFLDPFNIGRIRAYCAEVGATEVEVQPFPNHYGVRFTNESTQAQCQMHCGSRSAQVERHVTN